MAEARDGLKAKDFSALELTDAFIAAIDQANPALNAYVLPTPEHARAQAKASDERLAAGKARPGIALALRAVALAPGSADAGTAPVGDDDHFAGAGDAVEWLARR